MDSKINAGNTWIHCNMCFQLYSANIKFVLLQCEHVLCVKCCKKGSSPNTVKCALCKADTRYKQIDKIDKNLEPFYANLFNSAVYSSQIDSLINTTRFEEKQMDSFVKFTLKLQNGLSKEKEKLLEAQMKSKELKEQLERLEKEEMDLNKQLLIQQQQHYLDSNPSTSQDFVAPAHASYVTPSPSATFKSAGENFFFKSTQNTSDERADWKIDQPNNQFFNQSTEYKLMSGNVNVLRRNSPMSISPGTSVRHHPLRSGSINDCSSSKRSMSPSDLLASRPETSRPETSRDHRGHGSTTSQTSQLQTNFEKFLNFKN